MSKNRRGYNDEEKAMALAALDANGGNVYRTALQLGIPDSTLDGWAKERGVSPAVHALREVKKGTLAEKFDEVAHMALDLTIDDLEGLRKAGPQARIIVAGIATEKKLLLTGQPTQITEHRLEAARDAYERIKGLVPADEAKELVMEHFELGPDDWRVIDGAGTP